MISVAEMATGKMKLVTSVLVYLCFLLSTSKSLDYDQCGLRSVTVRSRIIGGVQSRPGMWPWQVAIYKGSDGGRSAAFVSFCFGIHSSIRSLFLLHATGANVYFILIVGSKAKKFMCGGALVDTKWIVTTAHCFFKISETSSRIRYVDDSSSPNKYHVIAGDYNIFRKEDTEQVRQVRSIRIFPGYRHAPFYESDIALVELQKGVTLGTFVRTICIPDFNEKVSVPGTVASVAGWGRTTMSIRSPVLRQSAYQIQDDDLCDQATVYFFNSNVTFCAGSGKGGNDTCQGDSGSGLVRQVLRRGAQRWVAVGLVSWGEGCGIKGKYGYYTRMEPFVPWIKKTMKVSCGNPGSIPNGRFTGKDFSENSRVRYRCKRGYKLKGRSRRKCRPNGQWSKAPVCQKVQCPSLSHPSNGSRRPAKRAYFYRDRVRFSCKTNFTRIGRSSIVCQHDATWSGFQAFCLAPCSDPGIPKGGSRLDHSFKHTNLVRFSCKQDRKMEGAGAIRCNKGRWSESPPKCIAAMCAQPRAPSNGNIHRSTRKSFYNSKDRVRFICNIGYKLDGEEVALCSDGKWNKDPPKCKRLCRKPGRPSNGGLTGKEFFEGRPIRFFCHRGFHLIGSRTIRCLPTGRWSGPLPECKGGCEVPDNFTDVQSSPRVLPGETVQHRSRITFSCLNNKTLTGSKEAACDDGKWSDLFPKCEAPKTHCSDPGIPENGYVMSLSTLDFPQGTTVSFACNDTYKSQGYKTIECRNGNWSHDIPKCLAPCKDPGVPKDGIRYDKAFQHDDQVRFACKSGKTMKGASVIKCNNGRWNHNTPECMGTIRTVCHSLLPWSDIFCDIK